MPGLPQRLGALPAIHALQTRAGRLSFVLSGRGAPVLLLFNGAGMPLDGWRRLYPRIERLGTVFAWNRPGVQGSDAPRHPQTGAAVIAALRELLGYCGLKPPYLLVAHSLGGLHANLFARLYPGEVAGAMFVEAAHPLERATLRRQEPHAVRALGKMLSLPQRLFRRNLRAELACIDETAREIEAAGDFPPVAVRVITGGRAPPAWMLPPADLAARRAHQQELACLSPRGTQVIAQASGHFPQLTQPQVVLEELRSLRSEL
jgi:pimeloyl-ACP methyl ester carboxylesterase